MKWYQAAVLIGLLFCQSRVSGQSGIVVTGQSAQTATGKISASIGQVAYLHETGSGGSLNQGIQQSFTITIDVQEQNQIKLSVFPNPTQDAIFIEALSGGLKTHVEVFSGDGQKVLENTFQSQKSLVNLNALSAGIYIMRVSLDNKEEGVFRIIKQ